MLNIISNAQPLVNAGQSVNLDIGIEQYTFDRIGNFMSLNRGLPDASMQQFNYTYDPGTNRLTSAKGNYTYDASGNLLTDDSKGLIATIYGRANLPTTLPLNRVSLSKTSGLVTRAQRKKLTKRILLP